MQQEELGHVYFYVFKSESHVFAPFFVCSVPYI